MSEHASNTSDREVMLQQIAALRAKQNAELDDMVAKFTDVQNKKEHGASDGNTESSSKTIIDALTRERDNLKAEVRHNALEIGIIKGSMMILKEQKEEALKVVEESAKKILEKTQLLLEEEMKYKNLQKVLDEADIEVEKLQAARHEMKSRLEDLEQRKEMAFATADDAEKSLLEKNKTLLIEQKEKEAFRNWWFEERDMVAQLRSDLAKMRLVVPYVHSIDKQSEKTMVVLPVTLMADVDDFDRYGDWFQEERTELEEAVRTNFRIMKEAEEGREECEHEDEKNFEHDDHGWRPFENKANEYNSICDDGTRTLGTGPLSLRGMA